MTTGYHNVTKLVKQNILVSIHGLGRMNLTLSVGAKGLLVMG